MGKYNERYFTTFAGYNPIVKRFGMVSTQTTYLYLLI